MKFGMRKRDGELLSHSAECKIYYWLYIYKNLNLHQSHRFHNIEIYDVTRNFKRYSFTLNFNNIC